MEPINHQLYTLEFTSPKNAYSRVCRGHPGGSIEKKLKMKKESMPLKKSQYIIDFI